MRSRSAGHHQESGFTLLEVLVSLALVSLITVLVANGFEHTRRVATLSEELDGAMSLEAVRGYLSQTLANAHLPPQQEGRSVGVDFTGGASMLSYLAPSDGLLDRGGLYRIVLSGATSALTLSREPFPASFPDAATERPRTIEASGLQLRYWGRAASEDAPRWHEAWPEGATLPLLVEIRLDPTARRAVWPPLVVRLLQGG